MLFIQERLDTNAKCGDDWESVIQINEGYDMASMLNCSTNFCALFLILLRYTK